MGAVTINKFRNLPLGMDGACVLVKSKDIKTYYGIKTKLRSQTTACLDIKKKWTI